jgi:hypothetical protein
LPRFSPVFSSRADDRFGYKARRAMRIRGAIRTKKDSA